MRQTSYDTGEHSTGVWPRMYQADKRCIMCKEIRPLEQFETARFGKFGRGSRCNACNSQRRRIARKLHALRWLEHDAYSEHATGVKVCGRCKQELAVTLFALSRTERDGLQHFCKRCSVARWQEREYARILQAHETCEICGSTERLGIDHDHQTGRTRGVLCRMCNTALGAFRDNIDYLKNAIAYLESKS